jgi:hypothetical protein
MSHKLNHTDVNFLDKGVVMVTILWYLCITTKLVNSISPLMTHCVLLYLTYDSLCAIMVKYSVFCLLMKDKLTKSTRFSIMVSDILYSG